MLTFDIRHFESITSTNDIAKELLQQGGKEGLVIWADEQTRGRGRMGRRWISAPGNLYFSLVLEPHRLLTEISQLSILAAVAVGDMMASLLPDDVVVSYKWPNDILLNGQKVCGILLETHPLSGNERDMGVVIGIGINLQHAPENTIYPATSLLNFIPSPLIAAEVLPQCLAQFQFYYAKWLKNGFSAIRQPWKDRAFGLGKRMIFAVNGYQYKGNFIDIDGTGAMLINNDQGDIETISSAEILFA